MCALILDVIALVFYFFRNMHSHSTADGETTQFLANETILWKGFLNMLSVAKFMTKGYVVSGSGELLKPVFTFYLLFIYLFHPLLHYPHILFVSMSVVSYC